MLRASNFKAISKQYLPHIICLAVTILFATLAIIATQSKNNSFIRKQNEIFQEQIIAKSASSLYTVSPDLIENEIKILRRNIQKLPENASCYSLLSRINQANEALKNQDKTKLTESLNSLKASASTISGQLNEELVNLESNGSNVQLFGLILPNISIVIFWIISALGLVGVFISIIKYNQNRDTSIKQNQQAMLDFLNVINALSEGDLTVQASVSEDITGTLADSFNYSVESLRNLVAMVNQSTRKLSEAVGDSSTVAEVLLKSSKEQAKKITEASDTVMHVTGAMLDVSSQTSAAVDIALSSTDVARSGSERVRSTIVGMDQIRDHIQETSKRIKRLGESSQEIGDIVELINDIADQTHILALNASIQAAAAGDAGRGFAVVADEIQRLAERTGNATRRVENIVKTIQTDTNEAIFAMEKSTSEVVNGANLAERAGESLNEIESVSTRLATLIQNVSRSSRDVSSLGNKMKSSIDSIKKLTEQNVTSTQITNNSVEKINELANELRESISGFKIN